MNIDRDSGSEIQAFPIHPDTYVSPDAGMTGLAIKNGKFSIIHAVSDGTLTVHFGYTGSTTIITLDLPAGSDVSIDYRAETIDFTAKCWVS